MRVSRIDLELVTDSATAPLLAEHALQREALRCLDAVAGSVESGAAFPSDAVAELLTFFREFGSEHHEKEDAVVVPLALAEGPEDEVETVGRLLAERERSQELLFALMLFWEPEGDLRDHERRGFVDSVRTFVHRQEREMELEERVLYPWVDWAPDADRERARRELVELGTGRTDLAAWQGRLDAISRSF